ncbi:MAG: radical SAM family heme chaperone HemW [Candidatus Dadabacteria bacterium]|nr:radical SAM family heme chaperone HemW [Candidatus Dadabacteria bacterium]NIX15066.1 radical SAM family heme chaperone HemW [Candidatus Dadabacteria bacterium]
MDLALYIHIPYCITKCPYCDFNSYGVGTEVPEDFYTDALIKELFMHKDLLAQYNTSSIFFGGGTPSLFSAKNLEKILKTVSSLTKFTEDTEITVEVNPKTADIDKFRSFKDIGINRLSIGIQSFSTRKLNFLGRLASPSDNRQCIEQVISSGMENFNVDLMYGTTDETFTEWEDDLLTATEFKPNHISAYCLTIENGTEFKKRFERGDLVLPKDEVLAEMIDFTTGYLEDKGYSQYEISNYSKPGFECLHNKFYWQGKDYLGIGAGAHSHLRSDNSSEWGKRWSNVRYPGRYIDLIRGGKSPFDSTESLTRIQAFEDDLMMGIRLMGGLDLDKLNRRYNISFNLKDCDYLFSQRLITQTENSISLSKKGVLVSDYIISRLVDSAQF